MVSTTVNKTQVNPSSISIKMKSTKATKATKTKTTKVAKPFDMHKFLLRHHSEDNIHLFGAINGHWNWIKQIKASNVGHLEGLVIFLDNNDKVLYIGHTSFISHYVQVISIKNNIKPSKIFIVCNENPSKYVHAVNAYRAKFKPLLNSERNQRFVFDSANTVINLSNKCEKVLDWIKRNPNSTRKDFFLVFSMADLAALCKCFSLTRVSYKDLKDKIFKVKSNIKVVSQQEILS